MESVSPFVSFFGLVWFFCCFIWHAFIFFFFVLGFVEEIRSQPEIQSKLRGTRDETTLVPLGSEAIRKGNQKIHTLGPRCRWCLPERAFAKRRGGAAGGCSW